MTTEITITAGVTAVVILLTTLLLLVIAATKVFSRSPSPDINDGGAVVPDIIPHASSSSSSSTSKAWKYDVFLSFRGEDTRKTFVDHLYSALQQHHILTYKDDVTLDRGDTISPALLTAIRESHIALIIFSENYTDSSWCLDELTHIMKCKEDSGQIVLPIFYNVDPSDVRKQKGKFGKAFAKHKSSKNKNKWKKALDDASNIAGWETKHVANGHEARCIQEIVRSILDKFPYLDSLVDDEKLVGMGTRLQQLRSLLSIGSGGVRMVGIWGLGGAGKTTLATSLYMKLKISGQFHGCCFVENIREESKLQHGLKGLQEKILSTVFNKQMQVESVELGKHEINKMLCRRNVLIVLDDVDHLEQQEALAGCHNWFGNGSRIIITTRDEQVLESHRVDEVCPVSLLSNDEAIRLFKRHAYREHNPVEDYEKLSLQVITYCNHLPLALKILGAFLYGKDLDEWISTLARLKDHPEMGIVEKLKISYDGLKHVEKELFLDIACFHKGTGKKAAMKILDACGFYTAIGVKVLIQKALITVSVDGDFDMHDLVEEMAHYIVRGEHPNNPEKHSRIWRGEDIEDICLKNATMENDKIEAIQCRVDDGGSFNFNMLLSNMKKLRFLHLQTTPFDKAPSFLSNELRYIDWYGYPASPFPESFQPRKLVVLRISGSLQKDLWKGYKYLPCLKVLKLSWMKALERTPDIGGLSCLQKLKLGECLSLEEIHQSLGNHSSLVSVDVRYCSKLTRFPSIVGMDKLKILKISACRALVEFPKIEANIDSLVELSLEYVGIEVLPSTIQEYCTNLTKLSVVHCWGLKSIDGNFHALKGLQRFSLRGCKKLKKFLKGVFNKNLDRHGLRKLDLGWLRLKDGDIPKEVGELSSLQELRLSGNDFTRLYFSLSRLTSLKLLYLHKCKNLVELPELPSSLAILRANECNSLKVIKDDAHRRCKWLCEVSLKGGVKNIMGGERLLETMLQGMAIESRCMTLDLNDGSGIARGFEPRLIRGRTCRMQLPENWYNHFYGFLFCVACEKITPEGISMKHMEKPVGDSQDDDDDDDVYSEEEEITFDDDDDVFSVTYLPFSLLRHTSWWDPTSTDVHVQFVRTAFLVGSKPERIRKCGWKLVPKGAASGGECSSNETTPTTHSSSFSSSSSNDDGDYKCRFDILRDSKSAFKFQINRRLLRHY